jgi:hypothetical protein
MALDRQSMTIAIAMDADVTRDEDTRPIVLSLGITPELQPAAGAKGKKPDQAVKLKVDFKQTAMPRPGEPVSPEPAQSADEKPLRSFNTTITLEPEKIAVLADRSVSGAALVVAIDPSVIQRSTGQGQPGRYPQYPRTVQAAPTLAPSAPTSAPGVTSQPSQANADVRQELLRLRREIDQLLEESSTPPSLRAPQPTPSAPTLAPSRGQTRLPASDLEQPRLADPRRAEHQKTIRLMELDLKDAQLEIEAAKAQFEELSRLRESGTVSAAQVAKARLEMQRAEIRLEKLRVMLEAEKEQVGDLPRKELPAPVQPREGRPPSTR